MIYITNAASRPATTSAFEERGLVGRAPASVTNSGIMVFPLKPVGTTFLINVNHMHNNLAAMIAGKLTTKWYDYVNVFKSLNTVPVPVPSVVLDMRHHSDSDKEEIKKIGFTEEHGQTLRGNFFVAQSLSLANLRNLWKMGVDLKTQTLAGNTNAVGLLSFYYAWKGIAAFTLSVGQVVNLERAIHVNQDVGLDVTDGYSTIMGDNNVRDIETEGILEEEDETVQFYPNKSIIPIFGVNCTASTMETFWVGTDYKPTEGGVVFPYFDEMLLADKDFVAGVFFRYFSKAMVDSQAELSKLAPLLRKGFVDLYQTAAGKQLQHIYYGIQSAIETGSKFAIVVEGKVYRGFFLEGDNVAILKDGQMIVSESRDTLEEQISSMNVHETSVTKIGTLLLSLQTKLVQDVNDFDFVKARTSSRYMANQFWRRIIPKESEEERQLKELVSVLQYGDEFWAINAYNVERTLKCLTSMTVPEDEPMYLGGGMVFSDNLYVRILGVYGPKAPTISVREGGLKFMISHPTATDPNLISTGERKRPLQYIPVYVRSLVDSAQMWETVRRSSQIQMIPAKQKGAGKFVERKSLVCDVSGPAFDTFYAGLRVYCHETGGSTKRNREIDPKAVIADAERVAKRKKDEASVADLF